MEVEFDELKTKLCPKCKYYIDKKSMFKDYITELEFDFGYEKDCKFHVTGKKWICNFEEQTDGNVD